MRYVYVEIIQLENYCPDQTRRLLDAHTHRTDSSTWITKLLGKKLLK